MQVVLGFLSCLHDGKWGWRLVGKKLLGGSEKQDLVGKTRIFDKRGTATVVVHPSLSLVSREYLDLCANFEKKKKSPFISSPSVDKSVGL